MDAKKKNRVLLKKYGVTLKHYEEELAKHGGVCQICLRPPATRSLSVDHDHRHSRRKFKAYKTGRIWTVEAWYLSTLFMATALRKSDAVKIVRDSLKTASYRGILCMRCNRGLAHWNDNPSLLRAAASYLEHHLDPAGIYPPTTTEVTT